nr:NAD(P)/FAD-dependent oxidoreductase [Acidiferrobacterales bacterium]
MTQTSDFDAIIIGAGISGISAAYHLQKYCPGKRYRVLEKRGQLGGTWDLFNYPGIRSDSDMYTFGFAFKPWKDDSAIASKEKILEYLNETVGEFGIDEHIKYDCDIVSADWSSKGNFWNISTRDGRQYRCQFLFMCSGYYNY